MRGRKVMYQVDALVLGSKECCIVEKMKATNVCSFRCIGGRAVTINHGDQR